MGTEPINVNIIGGGNLGVALAIGLPKFSPNSRISITRRIIQSILFLESLNIGVSSDNKFEIGFDAKTALAIASQTVKGAAQMTLEEKAHPEQLIDRVTTPQGCTIVGLNEMEHQGFSSALIKGIKTSFNKINEL